MDEFDWLIITADPPPVNARMTSTKAITCDKIFSYLIRRRAAGLETTIA